KRHCGTVHANTQLGRLPAKVQLAKAQPSSVLSPISESIAWYAAISEICSQSRSWLHFAVENIDHRESRLIGPAWEEATTSVRDAARRIPSSGPEQQIASWATISVIIASFRDAQATSATDNHKNIIFDRSSKARLG